MFNVSQSSHPNHWKQIIGVYYGNERPNVKVCTIRFGPISVVHATLHRTQRWIVMLNVFPICWSCRAMKNQSIAIPPKCIPTSDQQGSTIHERTSARRRETKQDVCAWKTRKRDLPVMSEQELPAKIEEDDTMSIRHWSNGQPEIAEEARNNNPKTLRQYNVVCATHCVFWEKCEKVCS